MSVVVLLSTEVGSLSDNGLGTYSMMFCFEVELPLLMLTFHVAELFIPVHILLYRHVDTLTDSSVTDYLHQSQSQSLLHHVNNP